MKKVDAEGFKIPKIDRDKWKNSVFADDDFQEDEDDPDAKSGRNK